MINQKKSSLETYHSKLLKTDLENIFHSTDQSIRSSALLTNKEDQRELHLLNLPITNQLKNVSMKEEIAMEET